MMSQPDTFAAQVAALSAQLLKFDGGDRAALRRMEPDTPAPPAYWRLVTVAGFIHWSEEKQAVLRRVVRQMALLVPAGETDKVTLHKTDRPLGAVLCDGGDGEWASRGGPPQPVISEDRLARFLAMPARGRGDALDRMLRGIARRRSPALGIDCGELLMLALRPDDTARLNDIAREYYHRLDQATRSAQQKATA
ncbi:hypothetical protein P7L65_20310 [Tistrella mobilis]|uniref:hypothetical protein n=2 Tax=Tistrella mobilis TaxID=171437 RepID=UPI003557A926